MALFRVTIMARADGQDIRNVLHLATTSGGTAQGVADDVLAAWKSKILPQLHQNYSLDAVEAIGVFGDDVGAIAVATGSRTGVQGADSAPTWVCASVRLQTGRRGRSGQGRFGLGPLSEQQIAGNSIAPTATGPLQAAVTAFFTDLSSSGDNRAMTPMVVSYVAKGVKRPEPIATLVNTTTVSTTLGSRLSRHPKR